MPVILVALLVVAAGEEPPTEAPIRLELPADATNVDLNALAALLHLELGTPVTLRVGEPARSGQVTAIRLSFASNGIVDQWQVTVVRVANEGQSAVIDLRDVPVDARARALALAVAEVVRVTAEPPKSDLSAAPDPPPTLELRTTVDGAVGVRFFPVYATTLTDVRAGVSSSPLFNAPAWRARVDVGVAVGSRQASLGRVGVVMPSSRVAAVRAGEGERYGFEVGPELGVGYAIASGTPNEGVTASRGTGWIVTAGLAANARVRIGERAGLELGLQLGHVLRGLELVAGDRPAAGIGGPFMGVTLRTGGDIIRRSAAAPNDLGP